MKKTLLALSLLFLSACGGAAPGGPDQNEIEAAVRARLDSSREAWNRGDLDGYLSGYWDSEKTRWTSGGTVLYGKEAIAAAYKARYPSSKEMGSIETAHMETEVLSETDAIVFGHQVHTVGGKNWMGIFTVHLRKTDGGWFVVSDHFSTAE